MAIITRTLRSVILLLLLLWWLLLLHIVSKWRFWQRLLLRWWHFSSFLGLGISWRWIWSMVRLCIDLNSKLRVLLCLLAQSCIFKQKCCEQRVLVFVEHGVTNTRNVKFIGNNISLGLCISQHEFWHLWLVFVLTFGKIKNQLNFKLMIDIDRCFVTIQKLWRRFKGVAFLKNPAKFNILLFEELEVLNVPSGKGKFDVRWHLDIFLVFSVIKV